jgi:hypothetical protein
MSVFRMERSVLNHVHNLLQQVDIVFNLNLFLFEIYVIDECQMTVMGRIILRFFYKVWFFGAVYFCLSWLFLVVSIEWYILLNKTSDDFIL